MGIRQLVRVLSAMFVGLALTAAVTITPAEAHQAHQDHRGRYEQRLLAELWKDAFRTPWTQEALGRSRDLKVDPTGNLYLCARAGGAIAPFTKSAKQMYCRARPGQPLLLVGASFEWSFDEDPGYTTEQQLRQRILSEAEGLTSEVLLDGRPLPLSTRLTDLTAVNHLATPNFVSELYPGTRRTKFVAIAQLIVIPAPAGRHVVEFRAGSAGGTAVIDAQPCWPHP